MGLLFKFVWCVVICQHNDIACTLLHVFFTVVGKLGHNFLLGVFENLSVGEGLNVSTCLNILPDLLVSESDDLVYDEALDTDGSNVSVISGFYSVVQIYFLFQCMRDWVKLENQLNFYLKELI